MSVPQTAVCFVVRTVFRGQWQMRAWAWLRRNAVVIFAAFKGRIVDAINNAVDTVVDKTK